MLIVLGLVGAGLFFAYARIAPVFLANLWLNGTIVAVFLLGVVACFWQVAQLVYSVNWIEGFAAERPGHQITQAPRLLAPLAALLRTRGKSMKISASSARSILDSVAARIDEARDITRYLTSLLVFLGLLGTFYGLATTIPAVVDTIRALAPAEGESGMQVFDKLMTGLEAQLGGMGTAFSSSLLGLAGSLVVGLLELFAGHGQNRFFRELEEWVSGITRLGFAPGDGEGAGTGGSDGAIVVPMLEQLGEQITALTGSLDRLVTRMQGEGSAAEPLTRLADGQERIIATLQSSAAAQAEQGGDAEARMRLRSIDVQLLRILEEISAGRQEAVTDLRSDLAILIRAVRLLDRIETPATRRS